MLSSIPKKDRIILWILLIVLLLFRLPHLANSPLEYHGWRQSDTEAMARNFVQDRFNIFYPQLNYDGPGPNYAQLELQITTFLIAILYKFLGSSYVLARLVPLVLFLGSALFLYLTGMYLFGRQAAAAALILYGLSPYNIFFSRAIMPESAALFFFVGAFYFFLRGMENEEKKVYFYGAAIFTALAITQKVPTIFIGIPFLYLLYKKHGLQALVRKQTWIFALTALGLPLLYFIWLQSQAKADYVSGIARVLVCSNLGSKVFSFDNLLFFDRVLPQAFTKYGLVLALAGLLAVRGRGTPVVIWFLAMVLEQIIIAGPIGLEYYVLLLSPPLALLGGRVLDLISCRIKAAYLPLAVLFFLLAYQSWIGTPPLFQEDVEVLGQAELVGRFTTPGDLIVTGQYNPRLLNMSHRKGWRANLIFPGSPQAEINFFAISGARYFIVAGGIIEGDEEGTYLEHLKKNLPKVLEEQGVEIYRITLNQL